MLRKKGFSPTLFSLLILLAALHVYSQPTPRHIFDIWTAADGLPQNSILCLLQDNAGYIWSGTQSGLVRFDGVSFRIFNRWTTQNLKRDRITALCRDNNGTLWIGTDGGGLAYFSGKGEGYYSEKDGLTSNHIKTIYYDPPFNLIFC